MTKKKFALSIILTIILTLLCSPFYIIDDAYLSQQKTKDNRISRIDIFNSGASSNRLEVIQHSPEIKSSHPGWFKKPNGQGIMLETNLKSRWKNFDITLKAVGNGKLNVALLGPDIRNNNNRFPVLVDYKKLSINGKEVLSSRKSFWHDKRFNHAINVKNGDIIKVSFTARRHHFRVSDLRRFYNFNWYIFSSILIVAFLLSRKLVNYVAMFKVEKKYSRIDIALICFFFAVLFIPMLKIDNDEKSLQENRMLAKYIPLFNNKGINLQYGKQFDSWFNDHFWGRNLAIKLNSTNKKINKIIYNGKAAFNTENNWIFNAGSKPNIKRNNMAQIEEIFSGLNKLNEFAEKNNIKLYVLVVPDKSNIYLEHNPHIRHYAENLNETAIKYFINKASFPIIYPYDELMEQKDKEFVFFKTEHHWTEWGAYIGYQKLINAIKHDFPSIPIVTESDYDVFYNNKVRGNWNRKFAAGQTFKLLNIYYPEKKLLDTQYKYYTPKVKLSPQIVNIKHYLTKYFQYPNASTKIRAIATGTSMNENLMQFLPYSFSELKYFRLNNVRNVPNTDTFKLLKRYKKDILEFKPDVLILTITADNIWGLKNLTRN